MKNLTAREAEYAFGRMMGFARVPLAFLENYMAPSSRRQAVIGHRDAAGKTQVPDAAARLRPFFCRAALRSQDDSLGEGCAVWLL